MKDVDILADFDKLFTMKKRGVPDCCRNCTKLGWDSIDEYSPPWPYCEKNVFIPVRKLSCKKQVPRSVRGKGK